MTDIENLLRDAYRARADLVTEDDLTLGAPEAPAGPVSDQKVGSRPSMRRFALPLTVAATVAALAAGAVILASRSTHKTTPPVVDPTPAPPAQITFTVPKVNTWHNIGPGWTVALTSSAKTTFTLVLVDPSGARTTITTLHSDYGQILDWSQNRQRVAVFLAPKTGNASLVVIDLASHSQTSDALSGIYQFQGFNDPEGTSYDKVVDNPSGHGQSIAVVPVGSAKLTSTTPTHTLQTLQGSAIVAYVNGRPVTISGGASIAVRSGARVLASVPSPGGSCAPVRVWSTRSVLVLCSTGLVTVSFDGGHSVLVSKPDPGIKENDGTMNYPYGLSDAVTLNGQTYVIEGPPCGSAYPVARLDSNLVPRRVGSLHGVDVSGAVTGATDKALYLLQIHGGCPSDTGTLYRYDPAANTMTTVLSGVTAAITVSQPFFR